MNVVLKLILFGDILDDLGLEVEKNIAAAGHNASFSLFL